MLAIRKKWHLRGRHLTSVLWPQQALAGLLRGRAPTSKEPSSGAGHHPTHWPVSHLEGVQADQQLSQAAVLGLYGS